MKEYNLEVLISGGRKARESNVEKHPQSQTKKTPTRLPQATFGTCTWLELNLGRAQDKLFSLLAQWLVTAFIH